MRYIEEMIVIRNPTAGTDIAHMFFGREGLKVGAERGPLGRGVEGLAMLRGHGHFHEDDLNAVALGPGDEFVDGAGKSLVIADGSSAVPIECSQITGFERAKISGAAKAIG